MTEQLTVIVVSPKSMDIAEVGMKLCYSGAIPEVKEE
jgi:hypothetical protein